jgi:hypothetical protein
MFGAVALELTKGIEFFVFVVPTAWVTLLSVYFLIRVKC